VAAKAKRPAPTYSATVSLQIEGRTPGIQSPSTDELKRWQSWLKLFYP
jgi:hypothetical protein